MEKSKEQCSSLINVNREISSHPLSSILTTFFLLILLYFPNYLLPLLFSPVLISSLLLITTLLHFGSSKPETEHKTSAEDPIRVEPETGMDSTIEYLEQKVHFQDSLVEWGRKGVPLEVIYEEFEGEEEEENNEGKEEASSEHSREYYSFAGPQRRLDFMGFYTTDSDADSNSSTSSENMRFRWEEEEGEGMIEITLEEDNLIEIDLSICR